MAKLVKSHQVAQKQVTLSDTILKERFAKLESLISVLKQNRQLLAETIVNEMGKPIGAALGEVDKSISHTKYYIENAVKFTEEENVSMMNGFRGKIKIQPLGPTLGKLDVC